LSLPSNVSEADFLAAVEHIGGILSSKFRFGSHDEDDIRQLVAQFSLEALPRYDPAKGKLECFLYRHCSNQISNMRRNQTGCRSDPPCRTCYEHALGNGDGHENGSVCPKFKSWWKRRQTRGRLSYPIALDKVCDENESRMKADGMVEALAENRELMALIDEHLPIEVRGDFLRMMADDKNFTNTSRRKVVREELAAILFLAGVELDNELRELAEKGMARREERRQEERWRDQFVEGPEDKNDEQEEEDGAEDDDFGPPAPETALSGGWQVA
jgi:hypothetical protein